MSGSHKTMFGKSKFVTVVAIEVLIKYRINSLLRADQKRFSDRLTIWEQACQ
jgi:hypothetical protein